MGDVLTLIDKAQKTMDEDKAREAAEKMARAQFTLDDFLVQMREVKKLGPLQDLLAMLPGVPGGKQQLKDLQVDEGEMAQTHEYHLHDKAPAVSAEEWKERHRIALDLIAELNEDVLAAEVHVAELQRNPGR